MEQVEKLFALLQETPEMALWGLTLYFLFILSKLASWLFVVKTLVAMFLNKYFDYLKRKEEEESAHRILKFFKSHAVSSIDEHKLFELLSVLKRGTYIHSNDLDNAITLLTKNK